MAGSTGHVLSVLICPHGALRKWARWSRWVVGLVLCRGEVRGGEGGGGGGRGGRTTFGHYVHGQVKQLRQVVAPLRVVVGEARGQLLTEQGGGHGIFNRVAGRGVKGAQVNAATPACGAPLRQPFDPACPQLRALMQVYCKQVVDDAAPGVQLLRLVGNVCDAVEQVERVLAVVGDGVEVDVLQGLAHLHQQLGLAHACVALNDNGPPCGHAADHVGRAL
mmetsp:Transcript_4236/g.11436  ORF Transcript_4236/g.11436 Transcript_4236/m.11436 type:complete len:220 (-) Transcript_4236:3475-4134(-)